MRESPSTHDGPSGPSFGEQHEEQIGMHGASAMTIESSFIMIRDEGENDESGEGPQTIEETEEQVISMLQGMTTAIGVINQYPHIIVKLCDGDIINAESGESIVNLSQFIAANNLSESTVIQSDPRSQLSPQILMDGEYAVLTQTDFPEFGPRPSQGEVYNAQLSLTLAQLNESLVSQEESIVLIINEQMSQDLQLSQQSSQLQLSQPMLGHEEIVYAMNQSLETHIQEQSMQDEASTIIEVNNVELEVTENMQDLLLGFPEGWWEGDKRMFYNTIESSWGTEGVPNEKVEALVHNRTSKVPTNADCITYLYEYTEVDDPKIEDHVYYRRCKRPTNFEEIYRRHTFRIRRREYFARPAISIGGMWYPEPYLPDPEDPEWSWKEGIEMDRPAQSLFQLNEGCVFWDPYKHLRVNGAHPYYRWPGHEQMINRNIPPNPIRHVKRPVEQFDRFDEKNYPSSKFTSKGKIDRAIYHPHYTGFKRKTASDFNVPLDMEQVFYPPDGEERFKQPGDENEDSSSARATIPVRPKATNSTDKSPDIQAMRPYQSPPHRIEQDQPTRQDPKSWGSYRQASSISGGLEEWQRENKKPQAPTKTKYPDIPIPGKTSSESVPVSVMNTSSEPEQTQPSTSRGTAERYVILKVPRSSLKSNKLNELVAKVSPPARPILPRPPSHPRKSPSKNISGKRPTKRRR